MRPDDFDEWSIEDRLDHIVARLDRVSGIEAYKKMRARYATEEQYEREFGDKTGNERLMSELWFSAKEDYCKHKDEYDEYLSQNPQSKGYMNNIEAMRRVIDEEIEGYLLDEYK